MPTSPPSVTFQDQGVYELASGGARALFAPQTGGRLLSWMVQGKEVIPWPENADWSKPAGVRGGNPLLFPFIARHYVNGELGKWKNAVGQVFDLPHHGFARNSSFELVEGDGTRIHMRLAGVPEAYPGYPFTFQFDAIYSLQDNRMRVELVTTNQGGEPMPYYAGHHFYFAVPHQERSDWEVDLPCEKWGRQRNDGSGAIDEQPASTPVLQLADDSISDRFSIHPTKDVIELRSKSGPAKVRLHLHAGGDVEWYAVTTWTQAPESDFYCVEPWLGLPNAVHHGLGLRYLSPGESETAVCELEAVDWA